MNNNFLHGKTALVTGSNQGIGLAIAKSLAAQNMRIALHGLADKKEAELAQATVMESGARDTRFFHADMSDVPQIDTMMDELHDWGDIDILVNNAGIQITTSLEDATPQIWDSILSVNLSGAFHTMRRAMPIMAANGYGRVINIASVHALVASKFKAPYVASKFGLVGLSRVAALEYANCGSRKTGGVTVNTICPGWTQTAIIEPQILERAQLHEGNRDAGIADLLSEKQPSLRTSDPSEIGDLAVFLCQPQAHNITGTSIPVDGGWTAQ